MRGMKTVSSIFAVVLANCFLTGFLPGQEMDFRIETDVMLPSESKPVQQTLTLFRNGIAYDCPRETPEQVVVIDHSRERLTLLDATRKVQSIVDLPGLYAAMDSVRNQAATSTRLAIFIEDAGVIAFDDSTQTLSVGDKVLRYEATLQSPPQPAMAEHYAQFANVSAYLNAWQANGLPPFARIALNGEVVKRQAIPSEIARTTQSLDGSNASSEHVIKCRLHASWRLSKDDYAKIDEIDGMLVNFAVIPTTEYFAKGQSQSASASDGVGRGAKAVR